MGGGPVLTASPEMAYFVDISLYERRTGMGCGKCGTKGTKTKGKEAPKKGTKK